MPIQSDKNLYPGINPHLNSLLQNEPGGWESFHADHVTDIARGIDKVLHSGYFVCSENSLQLSEITDTTDSEEEFLSAVDIYQEGEGGNFGRPIARIELLSPANKPGGSHHSRYMEKRWQTLQAGLRLVEIDYLHESQPILSVLRSYPNRDAGAFPYIILVSDPRPILDKGYTNLYGVGVVEALPIITIPLAGVDVVILDLGSIYNSTFDGLQFYKLVVDYEQEPVNFETYTEPDKEQIHLHMKTISESYNESKEKKD